MYMLSQAGADGTKKKFKGVAYTLNVIQDMLEKIPEPVRTVCATAAFTGLSASELRGLRWTDYNAAPTKECKERQQVRKPA